MRVAFVVVGLIAATLALDAPSATAERADELHGGYWFTGPNTPEVTRGYNLITSHGLNGYELPSRFQTTSWTFQPDPRSGTVETYQATYRHLDTTSHEFTIDVPSAQYTGARITCVDNTCGLGRTTVTITYHWVGTGQLESCPRHLDCPDVPIDWTQTLLLSTGPPPSTENRPPTASFVATRSETDRNQFTFDNRSADYEDDPEVLTSHWDFGDGSTSTDRNPTHRYTEAGTHTVKLTVTDTGGATGTTTEELSVASGLVVNSTGDAAAVDPADGCDTGALVDGEAECTLRAAIEAANEAGGGEISFAIEGGGIPAISAATPLPALSAGITIDGTTQPGGWVGVGGGGARVLALTGGTSKVTGLALGSATTAIKITGGTKHTITGNRLGTNTSGTAADSTGVGVAVAEAADVEVSGNVSGAKVGVSANSTAPGVVVKDNFLGVVDGGSGPLGEPEAGVIVGGAGSRIERNVARGSSIGIAVLGAAAAGTTVKDNKVGVTASGGAGLAGSGRGIRIDATPDVTVSGNRVAGRADGLIQVTGSKQFTATSDGIEFTDPLSEPLEGTATAVDVRIADNTLGVPGDGQSRWGVYAWEGASRLSVTGNTVVNAADTAIEVEGGANHTITGNSLGSETAPVGAGIKVEDAGDSAIGTVASPNTIWSQDTGIKVEGGTATPTVSGNGIHLVGTAPSPGISLSGTSVAPEVANNTITGADVGIGTGSAADARITANKVTDGNTGIATLGTGATIRDNVVRGQATAGITSEGKGSTLTGNSVVESGVGLRVTGDDVTVEGNRAGLAPGSETVVGNLGSGIEVAGGKAKVTRNLVAGSGGPGIAVAATATAELRSNRIWQSAGGHAIESPSGPAAPTLAAVIRTGSGETLRRTLLLTGLPAGDAGKLEVFANPSCDAPEARTLMEIVRVKDPDERTRIIQIRGNETRDHFTVTYTDTGGNTSELSGCVSAAVYPDGDGDGSPDPLDGVLDKGNDPTSAVVATDTEQLLVFGVSPFDPDTGTGGGRLEGLSATDDPDPGSHPAGWELPFGAFRFRVTGIDPGGATTVLMTSLTGDDLMPASTYWKYGRQSAGGAEGWYDFSYDEATGTGASLTSGTGLPGAGLRRTFALRFVDGGRGDSDGGANGSITDPGGPVNYEGSTTTSTTSTTTSTTSTTTTTIPPEEPPKSTVKVHLRAITFWFLRGSVLLVATAKRPPRHTLVVIRNARTGTIHAVCSAAFPCPALVRNNHRSSSYIAVAYKFRWFRLVEVGRSAPVTLR